ncbi:MAG: hypothetical protein HKN25_13130 [Pyrinomonadaceae bacterium]|nr:hypothetical protein [Pyrinomonadaceae bacterium]
MYTVNIQNDFFFPISVTEVGNKVSTVKPEGGNQTYKNWGLARLSIPGMGEALFFDLGKTKLDQYTNPNLSWTNYTWGVLIRYQGVDAYYRYNQVGSMRATFDKYGTLHMEFDEGGMETALPEIIVK